MNPIAPGAAAAPVEAPTTTPKKQPRYHVVLLDDDDHSYAYVVHMLERLFGFPPQVGYRMAQQVDATGRAILLTSTFEHAEFKRDQVLGFGPDILLSQSTTSMRAVLEPAGE